MAFILRCDRCKTMHSTPMLERNLELLRLPEGWELIDDCHLCPQCARAFRDFMNLPAQAEAAKTA